MDTTLSPTTSRAVSVLAYSWMVAKQFVFIGLVCPAFTLAMFLGFSSGWSFTEAARWLVEEQAAAQQIGASTKPDHILVKVCVMPPREPGTLPPVAAVSCDEWATIDSPIGDVAEAMGKNLAALYLFCVLFSGVVAILLLPPSAYRTRERLLSFVTALIARKKGATHE